ncbi:Tetratricopeptide repeat protein [Planctomycetes bacterium CA13]|uniref:Tetratricopeptide repeat protein n=1 Tax=Novipirellula herctigrandis TaxID=2527986 RepID=A0A5C5Z5I9_9BACT|nr:Tetratricopeptide repeat protein [Planctomycetes bacterium CA13]
MPTVEEVLAHGWQLHQSGNIEAAVDLYRRVLAHAPRNANALVYLGIAQFDQRDFDASASLYRKALSIQSRFPIAWNNLGNSLRMLGRVDEAEAAFATALEQQPGYLSALLNRGTLWIWNGDIKQGLKWYSEGLKIDPNHAELHRNLGVIHLLLGNYELGWNEYRWRWQMPGTYRPRVSAPIWQGESVDGKSILLYPEQGRGDAIQFIRVASVLKRAGATVYVQVDSEMMPLFSLMTGIDMLLPTGSVVPPIDYHASFIDVVDHWYGRTGELPYAGDLFSDQEGYLNANPNLVTHWRGWLHRQIPSGQIPSGRRVGINWQGNPEHHADVYRSIRLESLAPLGAIEDVSLVSLQFGVGTEQIDSCSLADSIITLPNGIDTDAFTDTAAILKSLDVVVTSDTAIAHLAGALGINVLVMLGKVPDWRWLTEGDQTAWYPTMRLVRQTELGNWAEVVRQVQRRLREEPFAEQSRH